VDLYWLKCCHIDMAGSTVDWCYTTKCTNCYFINMVCELKVRTRHFFGDEENHVSTLYTFLERDLLCLDTCVIVQPTHHFWSLCKVLTETLWHHFYSRWVLMCIELSSWKFVLLGCFNPWRWDHYIVSKHQAPSDAMSHPRRTETL